MSVEIVFYRKGYAYNSSSTHGLIFTGRADTLDSDDTREFGWNDWTAADKESKLAYMLICLYSSYKQHTGISPYGKIIESEAFDQFLLTQFKQWVKENLGELFDSIIEEFSDSYDYGYIDHQSVFTFPSYRGKKKYINVEFAKDFIQELVMQDYVLLGGNDNEEGNHHYQHWDEEENNQLSFLYHRLQEISSADVLCEKDHKRGLYVLSWTTGGSIMKVRISSLERAVAKEIGLNR